MWLSATHIHPGLHCQSISHGSLTVEWNATPRSIFAPPILRHALVRPRVLLLEIRDFKDGVWILHFDFAGEGDAARSPPAYFWDRAAKETNKKFPWWQLSVAAIKVWLSTERTAVEAGAVWVIVPPQIKLWLLRFPKLLKELWFLLPCLFMLRPLAPSWIDKSETE